MIDQKMLADWVNQAVNNQPIIDMHTHLYPPSFGTPVKHRQGVVSVNGLMLWGIDELVTYHYLIAEVFRVVPHQRLSYDDFWRMSREEQADHIWQHLFVERSPLSEACRGVVTTLSRLGLDPNVSTLASIRTWFQEQNPEDYIDKVMAISGVSSITMTNAVFDDNERNRWLAGIPHDPRFRGVLRFDPLLLQWSSVVKKLNEWGYPVDYDFNEKTVVEVKRFLHEWCDRVQALYCAVSLPPDFHYPDVDACDTLLARCVLPVCEERNIPFAMMIGSHRAINSKLRDAGDMGGQADVQSVVKLCRDFPKNRFFVTMLARENQHELAVAARKFDNLMVFGCWWFLNNPSLIEEITRMRIELLGTSVIPQHSDARILDQLIYKWDHSRRIISSVLIDKYSDLATAGWNVTPESIARDVKLYFQDNFEKFCHG